MIPNNLQFTPTQTWRGLAARFVTQKSWTKCLKKHLTPRIYWASIITSKHTPKCVLAQFVNTMSYKAYTIVLQSDCRVFF